MKLEELKLDSLERERARLEGQLLDLRQRVDREREELKRVETLRCLSPGILVVFIRQLLLSIECCPDRKATGCE